MAALVSSSLSLLTVSAGWAAIQLFVFEGAAALSNDELERAALRDPGNDLRVGEADGRAVEGSDDRLGSGRTAGTAVGRSLPLADLLLRTGPAGLDAHEVLGRNLHRPRRRGNDIADSRRFRRVSTARHGYQYDGPGPPPRARAEGADPHRPGRPSRDHAGPWHWQSSRM